MDTLRGLITLLLPLLTVQATYDDKSPMVAFMCNRPAMYRSTDGWIKDDSTDCLKEPVEILNYCRKVYPSLDVRNVVESSKKVTINKWCGFGHNKCHHEFTVRPFRCLVGPFQSDALLVPEHCVFDHIHDSKECKTYEDWNKTSLQACKDRGMTLQSFAILQPCGIDRFNGVEFVCCPEEDEVDQFLHDEFEYYTTTTTVKPKQPPTFSPAATASTGRPTPSESDDDGADDADVNSDAVSANDIYNKYLHLSSAEYVNEHEYFLKAKSDLEKHHHEKVTKMMKEWAEARQHVQDLKSVDPKGAEKLNKEITARFQKTYQALEQEGMAEKKQLVALHQQRVQAALNEKKRHAMEHYMDVLTDEETDAARILKTLQHYIKAEQKDRLHSINHFKHLRDMDPAEAEAVREQTLNHLDLIQARIQQAVDMLNRAPKYEKKIRSQIEDYLSSFSPLDSSVLEVISQPVPKAEDIMRPADVVKEFQKQQQQQEVQEKQQQPQQPQPSAQEPDVDSDDADEVINTPSSAAVVVPSSSEPSKAEPREDNRKEYYDEEVMEDEHDMVIQPQPLHGDSIRADKFEVNSYIKQEPVYAQSKFSAPTLAIAIGSVTVFVVIVVGIVVLRKRAQRVPSSRGFVEVDQAGSPEERHVANMQMNGYENPTYLYFEMNGNA